MGDRGFIGLKMSRCAPHLLLPLHSLSCAVATQKVQGGREQGAEVVRSMPHRYSPIYNTGFLFASGKKSRPFIPCRNNITSALPACGDEWASPPGAVLGNFLFGSLPVHPYPCNGLLLESKALAFANGPPKLVLQLFTALIAPKN